MEKMRRQDRQTTPEEAWRILEEAAYLTLCMNGAEGAPYGVPLSFVRLGQNLYFHCATEGYKLECLKNDPRVWVSAIEAQHTLTQQFSVAYRSAAAEGCAAPVTDPAERLQALRALCKKYAPENEAGEAYASGCTQAAVWRISITGITGKVQND